MLIIVCIPSCAEEGSPDTGVLEVVSRGRGRLRAHGLFGFRAYDTFADAEQLVAVWGDEDGKLRVLVHGVELGARRDRGDRICGALR
ncbi:hypothetical protein ACIQU6_31700 [Streptomyces sp. NPDC090442]|uniref:hypothetical protein n=1 Tax=Streptomyces sp. NPDC090442 TaxID=3365962 RepID=UPI0038131383